LLNRHFTEKNKAESGQTTEKGHLFWTHHLSLLGHLLDLVDELLLLVLQALPLPLNLPDGLLQHPLILPQQLGWGLLLAEDEAHGDRRAGRKRPATSGRCPPTPIRRRLPLRVGLGSLVR